MDGFQFVLILLFIIAFVLVGTAVALSPLGLIIGALVAATFN